MSTTTENVTRPPRAPAASVVLTVVAIMVGLLLAPATSAAAAEPLPAGSYEVAISAGEVTLEVTTEGTVALTASDGMVVQLAFDDQGRVLDEFTVSAEVATYRVEVELADDGSYSTQVEQRPGDGSPSGAAGEVVSTVAQCAPAGVVARALGLPNHGTIVSAAASGLLLEAEVTDPVSQEVTVVRADFSSLAGAQDFCAQVDAAVPTLDEVRETLESQAAAARAARASAQQERAVAQAAVARARAAEWAAARAAERAAEQAAVHGSAGGPPDDTGPSRSQRPDPEEDASDGATGADEPSEVTDEQSGGTGGGGSTGDAPTDDGTGDDGDTDSGSTDGGDTTTSPGQGQGSGKPPDPGANGKGPRK